MNYEEARKYLDEISAYGSVPGLDSIRELLRRLGNPQDHLKFIHISGTNGKGSVLSYLSTVLTCAGYRTGCYISPALFSYEERYQVDGKMITKEALARILTKVREAADSMAAEGLPHPTVFEVETAISFLFFQEENCHMVVLETGMGGTLDATNIVKTTIMEVITSISLDHMDFLGSTLAEIAGNKAGIIKPDTFVVSAAQEPEAAEVIRAVGKKQGCEVTFAEPETICDLVYGAEKQSFTYKTWKDVEISLAGTYQFLNACTALEAVDALKRHGYDLPEEKVRKAMKETTWNGRFTVIHKDPVIILDGAHNPAAALTLRDSIKTYFPGKTLHYICGVFKDKDYEKVIEITAPLAEDIIAIETPGNPRALPAEELKKAIEKVNPKVTAASSIEEAVKESLKKADKDHVILAFGSLSFLGDLYQAVTKAAER